MNASKKQGFTLVELMVTVVCATILAVTVVLILFMGWFSWRANNDQTRLQRDAALAVRMMAHQIRMSETNNVVADSVSESLTLLTNGVRGYVVSFARTDDSLKWYINGVDEGFVITKDLSEFAPVLQTNGVLLQMVLVSTNSYMPVAVTNRTFINTRNKP